MVLDDVDQHRHQQRQGDLVAGCRQVAVQRVLAHRSLRRRQVRLHPGDLAGAHALLQGFVPHLGEGCLGTIAEIFDAEEPFAPRGCVAQAWTVAEVLRAWIATTPAPLGTAAMQHASATAADFAATSRAAAGDRGAQVANVGKL